MSKMIDRLLAGLEWVLDRGPMLALAAVAAWNLAAALMGVTVVLGKWSTEYLDFTIDRLFWGLGFAWVAFLIWDNRRLRKLADTPAWRIADKAGQEGYEVGSRNPATATDGPR